MFKRHLLILCTTLAGAVGLTGCSTVTDTVSSAWESATDFVPYFLKPYRADVHQGNLVTSEMALQLEKA